MPGKNKRLSQAGHSLPPGVTKLPGGLTTLLHTDKTRITRFLFAYMTLYILYVTLSRYKTQLTPVALQASQFLKYACVPLAKESALLYLGHVY